MRGAVRAGVGLAMLSLAAFGCGGSRGATASSLTGTVQGNVLDAADAVYTHTVVGSGTLTAILVADTSHLCANGQAYRMRSGTASLTIVLGSASGRVDLGEYTVWAGFGAQPERYARVQYSKRDASCQQTVDDAHATAVSGTVSLSVDANGSARGAFDVVVGVQADRVSGEFEASYCALPADFMTHAPNCVWQG